MHKPLSEVLTIVLDTKFKCKSAEDVEKYALRDAEISNQRLRDFCVNFLCGPQR
jgi:hypothetical protein